MTWVRTVLVGVVALAAVVGVPGRQVAAQESTCGWFAGLGVLFIDEAASYWHMVVPVPEGGQVEVAGDFPRARYMSLALYSTGRTAVVDQLADYQIDPDPGSANPFRTRSDRDAVDRAYTARVVEGREPAGGRASSTLYTESADGTLSSNGVAYVTLRVYLPDDVTDPTGGVGLPTITSISAEGERTIHEACPDNPGSGSGTDFQFPGGHGEDPPRWERFVPRNFGGNVDNSWLYETFMPSLGQVLTLRAKAPTWGLTADSGSQLRYWSLCSYSLDTTVHECVVDQDVPVDDQGYVTIVVSRAEDRPANATTDCGVAWLEAAPDDDTLLVFRHLLPDASFDQAIQHVDVGSEEDQMGEYYPAGTYKTVTDHEDLGCAEPADASNDLPAESDQAAAEQDTNSGTSNTPLVAGIAIAAVLIGALTLGFKRWRERLARMT